MEMGKSMDFKKFPRHRGDDSTVGSTHQGSISFQRKPIGEKVGEFFPFQESVLRVPKKIDYEKPIIQNFWGETEEELGTA